MLSFEVAFDVLFHMEHISCLVEFDFVVFVVHDSDQVLLSDELFGSLAKVFPLEIKLFVFHD
jgi:hypothetical protein